MTGYRTRLAAMIAAALALAGCGLFGSRPDYTDSREGRPLEIPPDLDSPSTVNALTIPQGGAAGAVTVSPAVAAAPVPAATPSSPVVAGTEATLSIGDTVAATWRRVGLALERSGVADVAARDEVAATYTVEGSTTVTRPAEGNFITRMFRDDKVETVAARRVVRVLANGSGSLVRIEDEQGRPVDDELARRLIAAIRQRLG